jgi:hypothetical protein
MISDKAFFDGSVKMMKEGTELITSRDENL